MLRPLFILTLGTHGAGHLLFVANTWGYWKTTNQRVWLFTHILHLGQPLERVLGLLWIVPLLGFVAATWGISVHDPRWPALALASAVVSSAMLLVWWGSVNTSSAVFALLFNIMVMIAILWHGQPLVSQ